MEQFNYYNRPMQKIGEKTAISQFIQNLLASTPLPIIDTVSMGEYVFSDFYYIYDHWLCKCTNDGIIGDGAELEKITQYNFGQWYDGITTIFTPKNNYYDSETHTYLGKYLRCIRDIYGVDYMPFYNCYNGQTLPGYEQHSKQRYNYIVPIKMNKTYTVSYSLNHSVSLQTLFYNDKQIDTSLLGSGAYVPRETVLNGRHYLDYYRYRYDNTNKDLYRYKNYLYLIFKTNYQIDSLSVLEGDYSSTNNVFVGNFDESETMNKNYNSGSNTNPSVYDGTKEPDQGEFLVTSKLQLLDDTRRDASYAFSNRLVEGLLRHTINNQEEIVWNIGRVQEKLGYDPDNIWRDEIQVKAFREYMATQGDKTKPYNYLDINGNIDKDIEYYLFGNNISAAQ